MESRMKNPAMLIKGANPGIQMMMQGVFQSGIDKTALDFASLRVGQMNNCELCIGQSLSGVDRDADASNRLLSVATWRTADCFTPPERAALALTEAITELKAKYDSVPDALWREVETHFDETPRAGLVLFICAMNMFTRINVATRQLTPDWQT